MSTTDVVNTPPQLPIQNESSSNTIFGGVNPLLQFLDIKSILHIALEFVVFVGIAFWVKGKFKKLEKKIEKITKKKDDRIEELEKALVRHNHIINTLSFKIKEIENKLEDDENEIDDSEIDDLLKEELLKVEKDKENSKELYENSSENSEDL